MITALRVINRWNLLEGLKLLGKNYVLLFESRESYRNQARTTCWGVGDKSPARSLEQNELLLALQGFNNHLGQVELQDLFNVKELEKRLSNETLERKS